MRALVGCETSGVVRRALAARGHDVWSIDLLPSEDGSNRHIVGDVRDYLNEGWDLLALFHTPCIRLCNSGVRWLTDPPKKLTADHYTPAEGEAYKHMSRDERLAFMWDSLEKGASLFSTCWNAPIECIAAENPIMHRHAVERIDNYTKPQIVQPWWFGEPFFKATGFHLKNLPPLKSTNKLTPPKRGTPEHKAWSAIHRASPGPLRWKTRSRTFAGIGEAIADQWGGYALAQMAA